MKYLVLFLILIGFVVISSGSVAYGFWIPETSEGLFEQSQTVFVGTITSVNVLEFERSNTYEVEENGIYRKIIENYTQPLDEYTVNIEEFLKNPQKSHTITMLEATVSGPPGHGVSIGGFELGDRVLFYVPKLDGTNQYSPESFKIPKSCDARDVMMQKRLQMGEGFAVTQDNIKVDYGNFTANKPIEFVFSKDMGVLDGKSLDVAVVISKHVGNNLKPILNQEIHAESKPCEWIASAVWGFTPEKGDYTMSLLRKQENASSYEYSGFSVKSDISNNLQSPLKQLKAGIKPKDIVCKQQPIYYELVMKKSNNQPVCIKGTSMKSLTLRGYIPEYNGVLGGPIPTDNENKITYDTMIVDGKTYYFTIINETMPWTLEGKKINFHDVIFTLFPRPMIDNLGGFCGSGTFGTSILFSDNSRELLNIRTPETECLDDFTKTDLTKISNHTNPQAGLLFSDNRIKLLVSTDSDLVIPRSDLFLQQPLRIEGLNDTYSVGQKIEFTVKFDGIGYGCGYPHLRIENSNHEKIWESGDVVTLCDPDMKNDHIKKEWKIDDNTHFGTPIIDKEGFYTLFVTFGHDVIQRDFWIK
jgi:hypothetical protein